MPDICFDDEVTEPHLSDYFLKIAQEKLSIPDLDQYNRAKGKSSSKINHVNHGTNRWTFFIQDAAGRNFIMDSMVYHNITNLRQSKIRYTI